MILMQVKPALLFGNSAIKVFELYYLASSEFRSAAGAGTRGFFVGRNGMV
jgi:hypothetical protein